MQKAYKKLGNLQTMVYLCNIVKNNIKNELKTQTKF